MIDAMRRVRGASQQQTSFAGWRMLAIAALAMFCSGPAQTYGVSVFVDPMLAELGWSRSLFSTLYSIGTLTSAGVLVLAGRQIDRVGNRLVMTLAIGLFGAAMLLLSVASHLLLVLLGFALLRAFGSNVLTLGARTLVPNWFHSRAGRAFSLLSLGAMLSQALVPSFNVLLLDLFGWRGAWRANALIMWLVLAPIVWFLVRDRPSDIGQWPDGVKPAEDTGPRVSLDQVGMTVHAALRTTTFWFLIGASVVPSLVVTGLAFNQVAIFTDRGLPASLAASSFAVEAVVALPMTLAAGWLVDRFPVRYVLMLGQVCLLIAMICLVFAEGPVLAFAYAAWRGASSGLWMVAADVAWPSYFGRRYLGGIRGVGFAVGVVGAAIGPIPLGLSYDLLGGYNPAITALMVLPIAAAIAVMFAKPPKELPGSAAPK